ncbi:hypothetical protein [Galactobacter caseinivorans]|uniref:Uncharacterized protein n=1 Tax=Galactobacter caseinivorans TaxID=2676123 RepID=A0A496PH36_9MICC|nr:hypothetical protein [Galactobacter caseinivorans]RKW69780.1 hypothetical protein DWQ67_11855 [Galactobacter caseinivorans]
MNILATAVTVANETAEHGGGNGLMWGFIVGGSMMLGFLLLLLITASFSNVGTKHEAGPDVIDPSKEIGPFGPAGIESHSGH